MLLRACIPLVVLALATWAATPAASMDDITIAYGVGLIEVFNSLDQLVCAGNATISLGLTWTNVEAPGVPTGFYESASLCATFAYPIAVQEDCTGAPGAAVRCDETDPPRWFELDTYGWFWYERDNLGIHFEVSGLLERNDLP